MERLITALLIDDDSLARTILQKFLEAEDNVIVVASLSNTLQAVEIILKHKPDVVFLDINMPYENGLVFANRMKELGIETLLVFTTAFRSYAIEAFDMKPFDFLVKPFGIDEISTLLLNIQVQLNLKKISSNSKLMNENSGKLKFRTNHGYLFLLPHEIIFIRSTRNYCELFLSNGKVEKILLPISVVIKEFDVINFRMINRSIIINLSYLVRIDKKSKKCVVSINDIEYELPVNKNSLVFFENLNSLKLG